MPSAPPPPLCPPSRPEACIFREARFMPTTLLLAAIGPNCDLLLRLPAAFAASAIHTAPAFGQAQHTLLPPRAVAQARDIC